MTSPRARLLWLRSCRSAFSRWDALVALILLAFLASFFIRHGRWGHGESSSRNRTVSAHGAIRAALEEYKEKFGDYPEPAALDEMISIGGKDYRSGSAHMLFQAVTGDGSNAIKRQANSSVGESDGEITDEERKNTVNFSGLPRSVIYPHLTVGTIQPRIIVDGWGRPFQYVKAHPDPAQNTAVNPTYDLWSYGFELPAETKPPTREEKMNPSVSGGWIKNW